MSDTPRTDKYGGTWASTPSNGVTIYEHARNLEREADKLAKQCVRNVEEIGQLRAALEQSQKREAMSLACIQSWKEDEGADAARLDWLISHGNYSLEVEFAPVIISRDSELRVESTSKQPADLREAIDAAMEAQNDEA